MKKKALIPLLIVVLLWLAVGTVDILRVAAFEKPVFSVPCVTADDGGSGQYQGLGYSFDIEGNFMPEDKCPGVTAYALRIFGAPISAGTRD